MTYNEEQGERGTYIMLVVGTLFWGLNFHLAQIATDYMSPMAASGGRYLFASLGMLLLYPIRGKKQVNTAMKQKVVKNIWPIIAVCMSGVFLFNYYFFKGLSITQALNGALIVGLNPIFTTIFAAILIGGVISKKQIWGILISFIGVIIVITKGELLRVGEIEINIGDLYILLACLLFAIHNVLIQKYLWWIHPILLTLLTTILGFSLFVIFSFSELLQIDWISLPNSYWWAVAVMGLAGTTLSFTFWNTGVNRIGAGKTALFLNLVPVFAALSGLFFDQVILLSHIAGGVFIGAGIYLAVRKNRIKKTI